MVASDWEVIREEMAGFGRDPDEMTKVYSNFVHVLPPGESLDAAAAKFRVFSGMDLDYWREFYLLGEAEEIAERIRGKVAALGGVEHVILNPLDWEPDTLERLAGDVLPLLRV
jgi:alkanesulfonate monooxygenase SsuD/methylene tetrahydromethanopterin reductase-like flavin-dependent oxidoreductase (luciferase family)